MKIVEGLLYSESHEWVKIKDDLAYIGITDYAQDNLGDIVFLELPDPGEEFNKEDVMGEIESVKAVSDLFIPVSGEIVKTNEDIVDSPEELNEAPFENWLVAIQLSDEDELDELMTAEEYEEFCE